MPESSRLKPILMRLQGMLFTLDEAMTLFSFISMRTKTDGFRLNLVMTPDHSIVDESPELDVGIYTQGDK